MSPLDIFLFLWTKQRTMIKSYGSAARFNVRFGNCTQNFINFSIIRNISNSGGTYQILGAFAGVSKLFIIAGTS